MPAHRRQGRTGPTQRQLRVGEEVRHTLSAILNRNDLHDPDLEGASITVSEVRMGSNLRSALVLIMPLAGANRDAILSALTRATPYLRSQIGRAVHLRYTPTLKFEIDTRFDDADRMDRLIRSLTPGEERRLADVMDDDDVEDDDVDHDDVDGDNIDEGDEDGNADGDRRRDDI